MKILQPKIIASLFIFSLSYLNFLLGQPFQPCTNGTQNSCQCLSSPLICDFNALNGFQFQMTTYNNSANGPDSPMCDGGNNTTAHNPTWIRFVAWCENIELSVEAINCIHGGVPGCNSRGIQLAVFPNCSWNDPSSSVACEVSDCLPPVPASAPPQNHTINVSMTGLIVGQTYSIVVDGCCRSACLVTINVISPPCSPGIGSWPSQIIGPELVAAGSTQIYNVGVPVGGIKFDWFLNSVLYSSSNLVPGNQNISTSINWNTLGTYQLCVDTENACVLMSSNPPPLCKTITVLMDIDGDGVFDDVDNCPQIPNPNQADCNNNGIGDACDDPDQDCDGVYDGVDNCLSVFNPFQIDQNQNGIGDACEVFPKTGINTTNPKTELHLSNGSLYIDNPEKGIVLKDNLGNCHIIKIVNGAISVTPITCP